MISGSPAWAGIDPMWLLAEDFPCEMGSPAWAGIDR